MMTLVSCSMLQPEDTWTTTLFMPSFWNVYAMLPPKVIKDWVLQDKANGIENLTTLPFAAHMEYTKDQNNLLWINNSNLQYNKVPELGKV